jgi:hypothetical protein
MLKIIKWVAVLVLLPILVIKEIYAVLKESGIEIPEADDVLSSVKEEMKTEPTTEAPADVEVKDYTNKMDF